MAAEVLEEALSVNVLERDTAVDDGRQQARGGAVVQVAAHDDRAAQRTRDAVAQPLTAELASSIPVTGSAYFIYGRTHSRLQRGDTTPRPEPGVGTV